MSTRALKLMIPGLLLFVSPLSSTDFRIDPVHTSVLFKVRHFDTSTFYGVFAEVSGSLRYDPDSPADGSITIEIRADSIQSREPRRDAHLKGPDFFNAKQFPVIRFRSSDVRYLGGDEWEVAGALTIAGITKQVVSRVQKSGAGTDPRNGNRIVGFEGSFSVRRSEFGMNYMLGPLGDEVTLLFAIEAFQR